MEDICFFTLPSSYKALRKAYFAARAEASTYIHLLQNVRVANIAFDNGFAYRLLPKRMNRIAITREVYDAVLPYVSDIELLSLIPHGFDFDLFSKAPAPDDPIIINYNMFKGSLASEVASHFTKNSRISGFVKSDKEISWEKLADNYKRSSVFVATPHPQEGLYLPGLEAMAAGHLLVVPDAIGNRFYCDFDVNCCLVPYEDLSAYVAKIEWTIENWQGEVFKKRIAAHETAKRLGMESEFIAFQQYLGHFFS